jgi:hypothetical protein
MQNIKEMDENIFFISKYMEPLQTIRMVLRVKLQIIALKFVIVPTWWWRSSAAHLVLVWLVNNSLDSGNPQKVLENCFLLDFLFLVELKSSCSWKDNAQPDSFHLRKVWIIVTGLEYLVTKWQHYNYFAVSEIYLQTNLTELQLFTL